MGLAPRTIGRRSRGPLPRAAPAGRAVCALTARMFPTLAFAVRGKERSGRGGPLRASVSLGEGIGTNLKLHQLAPL